MYPYAVGQLPFYLIYYFFRHTNNFHQVTVKFLLAREPFCLIKVSLHILVNIHLTLIQQFSSQGQSWFFFFLSFNTYTLLKWKIVEHDWILEYPSTAMFNFWATVLSSMMWGLEGYLLCKVFVRMKWENNLKASTAALAHRMHSINVIYYHYDHSRFSSIIICCFTIRENAEYKSPKHLVICKCYL